MIRYRFSKEINKEFSKTLKSRVNGYFKDNEISPTANSSVVVKTLVAMGLYFALYFIILFSGVTSIPLMFGLWMLLGAAQAFIGTAVMHDVLHGSFTKNKIIKFIFIIIINMINIQ